MREKTRIYLVIIFGLLTGTLIAFFLNRLTPESIKPDKKNIRIISLAPNITQTIFVLGLGDKLVGRSDFCSLPQGYKNIPSAGNNANTNYELLLKLKPSIILIQGKNPGILKFAKDNNVKTLVLNMDNLKTIKKGILKIGNALNVAQRARTVVENINKRILEIKKLSQNKSKKRVFIILNRRQDALSGIFTVGGNSFISEALSLAGAKNVFSDLSINYSGVSLDRIVKRNPEIIIEVSVKGNFSPEKKRLMRKQWQDYPMIDAVKNNQIYFVKAKNVLIPGPKIINTINTFRKIITGKRGTYAGNY